MNRDQHELQNYGLCGIYKESFNIIFSWKKIFTQITLALILPLSIICLIHYQVSQILINKVLGHELNSYEQPIDGNYNRRLRNVWIAFWSFQIACFLVVLILSLLSIAAVVYTIACIYTAKPVTFEKIMRALPKVWKRLTLTFLSNCLLISLCILVAGGLVGVYWAFVGAPTREKITTKLVSLAVYMMEFVYICLVWQLACVVSVLEDVYGRNAVVKEAKLTKGKGKVAMGCSAVLFVVIIIVRVFYDFYVVFKWTALAHRILIGIQFGVVLGLVILCGLVVQTVLYFVCKAYHHESIDVSALSKLLEAYLGEYVPLTKEVELQQV